MEESEDASLGKWEALNDGWSWPSSEMGRGILAGTEPSRCEGLWEQGTWDLAEQQEERRMAELGYGRPGRGCLPLAGFQG